MVIAALNGVQMEFRTYTFLIPTVVELLQDIVEEDLVEDRPHLMHSDLWRQLKHYNPHVDYSEQLPPYLLTNVLGDLVWAYAHPTSTEEQEQLARAISLIYRQIKHEREMIMGLVTKYMEVQGQHHRDWCVGRIAKLLTGDDLYYGVAP